MQWNGRVKDRNHSVGSHSNPRTCRLAQKMQTNKIKASMASLQRRFLLLCLLPFDKHDMRLGKCHFHKCFISPSPRHSVAGAWIMTSLAGKHLSQAHLFSFAVTVVPPMELPGWKSSVLENTGSFCVCWPIPCRRVYQAVNLCSFLKAKMNRGFLSFLLGCKHREVLLLLT